MNKPDTTVCPYCGQEFEPLKKEPIQPDKFYFYSYVVDDWIEVKNDGKNKFDTSGESDIIG